MIVIDTVSTDLSSTQWFSVSANNMDFRISLTVESKKNFTFFPYPMFLYGSDIGSDKLPPWD